MYWQIVSFAFLVGAIIAATVIYWYHRLHPRFDRAATVQWNNPFNFERAGYTLIALSVLVFFSQFLIPGLGIVAAMLLGSRTSLAVLKYQRYDPDTTGGDSHYIK